MTPSEMRQEAERLRKLADKIESYGLSLTAKGKEPKTENPMSDHMHVHGWIDEVEAQQLLRCKTTKLWAMRQRGELTFSKIGNRTWYKISSIERLLEENAQQF